MCCGESLRYHPRPCSSQTRRPCFPELHQVFYLTHSHAHTRSCSWKSRINKTIYFYKIFTKTQTNRKLTDCRHFCDTCRLFFFKYFKTISQSAKICTPSLQNPGCALSLCIQFKINFFSCIRSYFLVVFLKPLACFLLFHHAMFASLRLI